MTRKFPFCLFLIIFYMKALSTWALSVDHLRVQSLQNPQGVDVQSPLFSWQLQSWERGVVQTAYRLKFSSDAQGDAVVWDSGFVESASSVGVTAKGLKLQPSTRYFWHVTVRDNKGNEATSTETAYFDTGLMSSSRNPLSPAIWIQASEKNESKTKFDHYTLDFDMYRVKGRASIIFAAISSGNYHMWQINCNDYDQPAVRRHVYINGSTTTTNATVTQFTKSDQIGHLRHYRIEVKGNVIRTFIENTLVDTFTDSSGAVSMGDIGMRVYGTVEEAFFDNIKLTTYDDKIENPTVEVNEDFEGLSSSYFYTAQIEQQAGSRMCHMASATGENKIMQVQSKGAPMFRKAFKLSKPVREAKLYTSGLGIYDVFVNGQRVGHVQSDGSTLYEELKPGWTDYRFRVFYSSHDVSTLLCKGENAMGAVVTTGWWAGAIMRGIYGSPQLGFIAKLLVTYDDGTQETIASDLTWRSSCNSAIRKGDIYDGEIYDARFESAWTTKDYDESQWGAVEENKDFSGRIVSFTGGYVLQLPDKVQHVKKATIYEGTKTTGTDFGMINVVNEVPAANFSLKKGQAAIIDFGQNVVGWVKFKVCGKAGNRLHIRFSEMLNDTGAKNRANDGPGGSLYLSNLRTAKAELFYTLAGKEEGEEYHPSSTFYGFRYCEILPTDDVDILSIEAQPISSSTEDTGTLSTSDARVNQLVSNIQWGQRGNLLSVPTDCPQRDERLGWSGDTQAFCQTGMYNAETESFYRKWLQDMRDSQRNDGAYYTVAPQTNSRCGAGAWSDAGIIVPWKTYLMYGDIEVIRENFDSMEKYMEWLSTQTEGEFKYVGAATNYGDWLSYVETDKRYVSVAYYALDALLMAKMARALSPLPVGIYARKATAYEALFKNIRDEFRARYLTPVVKQTSQTAYLLALQFDLLDGDAEISDFINRLSQAVKDNDYKLNTGFVGTSVINPTLSRFGLTDLAYDLLLQRECPSWLYSVDQGATTVWERWNSYTHESGFGSASMNSFNHYAYGAVGEWMYRYMAGIEVDESEPGFHHFFLQPHPDRRTALPQGQSPITSASATFRSRYGMIYSAWTAPNQNALVYDCTVPVNATATLRFPASQADLVVRESGVPASQAEGVTPVGYQDGCLVYELASGSYHFETDGTTGVKKPSADNGQQSTDSIYDSSGRRVEKMKKGVYIFKGKKVLK